MTERDLINRARLHATQNGGLLFRNSVGQGWQGQIVSQGPGRIVLTNYRRVIYGLHNGSADLIGIRPVVVTPDMVGETIGQFWAVEIKTKNDYLKAEQKRWLQEMNKRGAFAQVMREQGFEEI